MPNNESVEQLVIVEDTNSSTSIPLHLQTIQIGRLRKRLLLLLSMMFVSLALLSHRPSLDFMPPFQGFSFVYLLFLGIACVRHLHPWLCEYFNHHYEFVWACVSLIFDGFWILFAYQYYSKGLRRVCSIVSLWTERLSWLILVFGSESSVSGDIRRISDRCSAELWSTSCGFLTDSCLHGDIVAPVNFDLHRNSNSSSNGWIQHRCLTTPSVF